MSYSVDVYKNGLKLGSGTAANGNLTITTYTANLSRVVGSGRNVQVTATTGNNVGATVNTHVVTDGGATLTISNAHPYS